MAQRLEENAGVSYVFITNPNFPTPNQLLRAINQEFEVPQSSKSYLDLLSIFKNFLMTQALTQQKTLVLIIDEAQTLKAPLRLADIEYTYRRHGIRTSENELTRIAINYFIEDYRKHGDSSLLANIIKRLNS